MSIGLLFWLIYVLWILFGTYSRRGDLQAGNFGPFGGDLLLAILLFLIGWKTFGFIIQG